MEVILSVGYALIFFYLIRRLAFFDTDAVASWVPASIFLVKCLCGVLLGLLYTYYYTNHEDADSFKFFTDSKFMFDSLFTAPYDFFRMLTGFDSENPELRKYYLKMDAWLNTNPIYNDNKTIVRLNAFFRFFSLGHYYVHVIFINAISFTGIFCLYKAFGHYIKGNKTELFLLVFLMPSLLFWGSGLLKDGILISGFGLFIYSNVLLMKKGYSFIRLAGFLTGFFILSITKVYAIALLMPGIAAWWVSRNGSGRKIALTFILFYSVYLAAGFNLYRLSTDTNLAAQIFYKQKNFIAFAELHDATLISFPIIECSAVSIIKNSPHAFSNVMFRPQLWDAGTNPLIMLASLENMFIVLLMLLLLISFNSKRKTEGIIVLFMIFIACLFSLIGLITPVLGAIVRYKIIALPCLIFIIVYYYDRDKLLLRLPFLRRLLLTKTK